MTDLRGLENTGSWSVGVAQKGQFKTTKENFLKGAKIKFSKGTAISPNGNCVSDFTSTDVTLSVAGDTVTGAQSTIFASGTAGLGIGTNILSFGG